jgi:hypothetical protein
MSDIVERLRQQATVEAKKFGDARDIQIEWRAAEEIERLRARVAKLERQRPSSVLGVEPFFDGGQWCAQYCKVAEFGPTPETALDAFDNSALSYAIAGMLEDE